MKKMVALILILVLFVSALSSSACSDGLPFQRDSSFYFNTGACIRIPAGFRQISKDYGPAGAVVSTYLIHFGQQMELTLTESKADLYGRNDAEALDHLYRSLKDIYQNAVYDTKQDDGFALSGYIGENIYYFQAFSVNQVIHLVKMYYPMQNRSVCDRYVEEIISSFCGTVSGEPAQITTFFIPDSPLSPYGIALRENLTYGVPYSDQEKKDVVTNTYYDRRDSKGNNRPWFTMSYIEDQSGYRLGFYYADGLLFFGEAYIKGQRDAVTFYFWGDQLLCVHDFRNGDKQLRYPDSETYWAVVREFGDVYAKGVNAK